MTNRTILRNRRLAGTSLVLALVSPLAACSELSQMQFTRDDSLQIAAPQNLSTVDLPFNVSWKADKGTAAAQRTAVFIDRYPMPPGADLRSVVDQDANCRGTEACLDAAYLSRVFGIYVTDETEISVQTLPVRANSGGGDSHFATVVPLDASGKRAGEALWFVSFQVSK